MKNILFVLLCACTNPSKADTPQRHLAAEFAAMIPEKITGKCSKWTDDAVLCKMTDTTILWCTATITTKPHCEIAIDWTPQPPKQPEVQPQPSTEIPPKQVKASPKK